METTGDSMPLIGIILAAIVVVVIAGVIIVKLIKPLVPKKWYIEVRSSEREFKGKLSPIYKLVRTNCDNEVVHFAVDKYELTWIPLRFDFYWPILIHEPRYKITKSVEIGNLTVFTVLNYQLQEDSMSLGEWAEI